MEQHGPMVQWSNGPMVQFSGLRAQQVFGTLWCHWPLYPGELTENHSDSENSPQAKHRLSCLRTIPVARMICWNTKLVAASLRSEEWDRKKVQQHHLYIYNILSSFFLRSHLRIMIQKHGEKVWEGHVSPGMVPHDMFQVMFGKCQNDSSSSIIQLSIIHDTHIFLLCLTYTNLHFNHSCSPSPPCAFVVVFFLVLDVRFEPDFFKYSVTL